MQRNGIAPTFSSVLKFIKTVPQLGNFVSIKLLWIYIYSGGYKYTGCSNFPLWKAFCNSKCLQHHFFCNSRHITNLMIVKSDDGEEWFPSLSFPPFLQTTKRVLYFLISPIASFFKWSTKLDCKIYLSLVCPSNCNSPFFGVYQSRHASPFSIPFH